jgi:PhnB protein
VAEPRRRARLTAVFSKTPARRHDHPGDDFPRRRVMPVKAIPDGYSSVPPYLMVEDATRFVAFVERAFGAVRRQRFELHDGRVMHAEVGIGDSVVMLAEAGGQFGPTPCHLHLYVDDADATYRRALAAGAESVMEPADQFYGDRIGGVRDAEGITWWIVTHVEDVSAEEIARRETSAR